MYEENYTFGGIPKEQALHWNTETWQALGNIVFLLTSGTPVNRKKALSEYFVLKRQFMLTEWDEYLDKVDAHRQSLGAPGIRSMITEVCNELRNSYPNFTPLEHEPVSNTLPELDENLKVVVSPIAPSTSVTVEVEQLSLF